MFTGCLAQQILVLFKFSEPCGIPRASIEAKSCEVGVAQIIVRFHWPTILTYFEYVNCNDAYKTDHGNNANRKKHMDIDLAYNLADLLWNLGDV